MTRDGMVKLIALGVMVLCLGASAVQATLTNASLGRNRLVYADVAEESAPPEVALGIAMGAFRGLFVNMLWIRANDLKEDGKYFEAVDLASTITKLQPRFGRVWSFHAWNLAYNISVATQTRPERWQWVQAGIRLLRDEGIPANPTDLQIHRELAWIHLHKVQGVMDDAHTFYKREFAKEWTIVMGPPPRVPVVSFKEEATKKAYITDWLRPIADAPRTLDEAEALQPGVKALVDRIRVETGLEPGKDLLERIELIRSAMSAAQLTGAGSSILEDPLVGLLTSAENLEPRRLLIRYMRRMLLTETYHMDIERMIRYTEKYGPLDWRHPAAHSLFWSAKGVEESLLRINSQNRSDFDILNTDRLTLQSVQELYRSGTLYFDLSNPDQYFAIQQPDFIPTYRNILDELTEREVEEFKITKRADIRSRPWRFYSAGYENFLRDAIRYVYRRGDRDGAEELYKELREFQDMNLNNPLRALEMSKTLDDFVVNEIVADDRFTSPNVAQSEIYGALIGAYIEGLVGGNDKVFTSNFEYARKFHEVYTNEQNFNTAVNQNDQGRMALPPFWFLSANMLQNMIRDAGIPNGPLMYNRAPPELRWRAYAIMEYSGFKASVDAQGKATEGSSAAGGDTPGSGVIAPSGDRAVSAFDLWFPPPPENELAASRRELIDLLPKEDAAGQGPVAK